MSVRPSSGITWPRHKAKANRRARLRRWARKQTNNPTQNKE